MCGIVSIFAYHPSAPAASPDELRRIRAYMAPRGPDGLGEWLSPDGRLALGHRRLSIIDLSERGAQPMATADGSLVVSFNGEIYNYRALRAELEREGAVFRSHSDTEVLLHLYARKGEAMLGALRGMFAFVLWDAVRRRLLLARDPYGIKPLYYADDGRTLRAASQVKALLAGGRVSARRDPAGLAGFFLFGSVPEPFTIAEDIRAVPAGSYVLVDASGPRSPVRYCSIASILAEASRSPERLAPPELGERVRAALLDSVRHHLVADVPVGAFLSSGVDSGSLVGLMRDAGQEDIQTVTLAFDEFRGQPRDETPLAERVAEQYGTRHTPRLVSEAEFRLDLPQIVEAMDQPSIDGVNTWFVSKAAREQGLKVAVSGLGGDELFGGYPSFRDLPRWVRLLGLPSRVPGLGRGFRSLSTRIPGAGPWTHPKAAGLIEYGGSYPGAYLLRRGLFMPWELPALLGPEVAEEGLRRLSPLGHVGAVLAEDNPKSPFARVAALESCLYMRNQLLRDTDWASMAHSLEVRVPLVDVSLLRSLAPCLIGARRRVDKTPLAKSPSRPLPHAMGRRAKTGFETPVGRWIGRSGMLEGLRPDGPLLSLRGHWARRWAVGLLGMQADPEMFDRRAQRALPHLPRSLPAP